MNDRFVTFEARMKHKAENLVAEGETLAANHNATVARLAATHAEKQSVITTKVSDATAQQNKAGAVIGNLSALVEKL